MVQAIHVIDSTVPRDALGQLAAIVQPADRIVSVGPPPILAGAPREAGERAGSGDRANSADRADSAGRAAALGGVRVEPLHAPMGSATLCGMRLADALGLSTSARGAAATLANDSRCLFAWSARSFWAARLPAQRGRLPLVLHVASAADLLAPSGGGGWQGTDARRLADLACARLVTVTAPTEHSRQALVAAGFPPPAVRVVPPAAAAAADAAPRRAAVRRRLGVRPEELLLVAPGEVTREGGQMNACWAHAMVSHVRPGAKLLLPGTGTGFGKMDFFSTKTGFASHVMVTRDGLSLADAVWAADAALFLQTRDNGVFALAAAMAAGLPCVVSTTGDAVEIGGAAVLPLADPRPHPSAAALLRLLEDEALRADLSGRAAQRAAARFGPARAVEAVAALRAEQAAERAALKPAPTPL